MFAKSGIRSRMFVCGSVVHAPILLSGRILVSILFSPVDLGQLSIRVGPQC